MEKLKKKVNNENNFRSFEKGTFQHCLGKKPKNCIFAAVVALICNGTEKIGTEKNKLKVGLGLAPELHY
jgi:hypothetical protein